MKSYLLLILLLFVPAKASKMDNDKITVVQINAKWNKHHNIDLNGLINCKVQFAWLEEQPKSLRKNIQTVPVVLVYNGSKAVMQWSADLSFQLDVDLEEIQSVIDKL
mgnify:CR=1 FL=1